MGVRRFLVTLAGNIGRDDVFILASSIAYAALLSVFPLLIGLIALLSGFVEPADARRVVLTALDPYLPGSALRAVRETLDAVFRTRGTAGVLAVLALLWGGTAVAGALRHSLNRVLHVATGRPYWQHKLVELAMVGLGGAFISLSLLSSAALAAVGTIPTLGRLAGTVQESGWFGWVTAASPLLFSGIAFGVIYWFLPNARVRARSLLIGSLTGLALFEICKRAFFWYVGTLASYPLVYGPLAGLVVFMVWVYLIAVVVLVGAEVMAVMERPDGGRA